MIVHERAAHQIALTSLRLHLRHQNTRLALQTLPPCMLATTILLLRLLQWSGRTIRITAKDLLNRNIARLSNSQLARTGRQRAARWRHNLSLTNSRRGRCRSLIVLLRDSLTAIGPGSGHTVCSDAVCHGRCGLCLSLRSLKGGRRVAVG